MASIPEVRFEGWVSKQGHFMPTWKKRYMVLEAYGVGPRQVAKISYYKSDKTDIPPQGIINLSGASVGIPGSEWVELKWYEFTVCTANGRMYPMRVDSRTERDEWRKRIAEGVRRIGGIILKTTKSNKNVLNDNATGIQSFSAQACLEQQAERDEVEKNHSQPIKKASKKETTSPPVEINPIMDSSILGSFHVDQGDGINFAYKPRLVPPSSSSSPPSSTRSHQREEEEHHSSGNGRMVQFPQEILESSSSETIRKNKSSTSSFRKRAQTSLESTLMFDDWMMNAGLDEHIELFKQNEIYTLRDIVLSPLINQEGFLTYQIGLVDSGQLERFKNLRSMAKETLCICEEEEDKIGTENDIEDEEEENGGDEFEEEESVPRQFGLKTTSQTNKAWDIDAALSGNASASFAEAVQRHDTPATIPIDTPANTAAANTAVKTNTPIDVSKSVEMRIDQPLGLGFDPTLTVVRVEEGSQAGLTLGCQIKSLAGEKVSNVEEFKAVILRCKAEGKSEATLSFVEPSEVPIAVPITI